MKTLYILNQGSQACLDGEKIIIKQKESILSSVQLPLIQQILVFGNSQITTQLTKACLKQNIPISYLSQQGKYFGTTAAIDPSRHNLRRLQYGLDPSFADSTARSIVRAKLLNSRTLLQRQNRRIQDDEIDRTILSLQNLATEIDRIDTLEQLRGIEGIGASYYFAAFDRCIDNPALKLHHRSRRPPHNQTNALLSFGYTILWQHLHHAIESQGLDSYCGCLHQDNARHPALVSDLIEEFRAPLVDALVLTLIHRHEIDAHRDFEFRDDGCFLTPAGMKIYLNAFTTRMNQEITSDDGTHHPRWHVIQRQLHTYKQFIYQPTQSYQPYRIR